MSDGLTSARLMGATVRTPMASGRDACNIVTSAPCRAQRNWRGGAPVHNVQDLSMVISCSVARRIAALRLVPVLGVVAGVLWTAVAFAQTPAVNPPAGSRPAA